MVREFEDQAESKGDQSITKGAGKYAEEYGPQLQLKHPDPVCVTEEGEIVPGDKLKTGLRKLREARIEGEVPLKQCNFAKQTYKQIFSDGLHAV